MFFGKKLKELRLEYGKGSRVFAKEIGIKTSDLVNIEHGYVPPPESEKWFFKVIKALGITDSPLLHIELAKLYREPFEMQKMPEDVIPVMIFPSSDDDVSIVKKIERVANELNKRAKEHNRKADEYNKNSQR